MRLARLLALVAPAIATNNEGLAFLNLNRDKEGVVQLPSGLQYKVLQSAPDATSPRPGPSTKCACHYEGTLIDGTVFDSSRKRGEPTTFAPNQVHPTIYFPNALASFIACSILRNIVYEFLGKSPPSVAGH